VFQNSWAHFNYIYIEMCPRLLEHPVLTSHLQTVVELEYRM